MITKDNISEILNSLGESEVNKSFLDSKDYVLLQVFITNSGYTASIESCDYSEEIEQEAADNGDLFVDKDNFLTLFKESNSINPFISALILNQYLYYLVLTNGMIIISFLEFIQQKTKPKRKQIIIQTKS